MFQFFNDFGFTCVVNERCDELRADKNMYYRKIPNSDCDYLVIANELFMVKGKKPEPQWTVSIQSYWSEEEIGKEKPSHDSTIIGDFQKNTDMALIKKYLYGAQNEMYIEGWTEKGLNLLIYKRLCNI